jgi:hypothetical protein
LLAISSRPHRDRCVDRSFPDPRKSRNVRRWRELTDPVDRLGHALLHASASISVRSFDRSAICRRSVNAFCSTARRRQRPARSSFVQLAEIA